MSPNFKRAEMQRTSTGLPNIAGPAEDARLKVLAAGHLERIRDRWGPQRVTSGYRSPEVNLRVGGASRSAHVYGCAADIQPLRPGVTVGQIWEWVKTSGLDFDQAIWERRGAVEWLHYGICPPWLAAPRRQAFTIWK